MSEEQPVTVLAVDIFYGPDELYEVLFEHWGYELHFTRSCEEALDILRNHRIDFIISEALVYVTIGGHTLLELVRRNPEWAAMPYIIVTARSRREDVEADLAAGADDCVIKPFAPDDLRFAIEKQLKRIGRLD